MSARTQTYLAGSGAPVEAKPRRNKLHREERSASVLPPPSQWTRGPLVYGHATNGLGGVGQTGYQTAYGSSAAATTTSGYGAAGGYGGVSGSACGASYLTTATGGYGGPSGLRSGGGYAGGGTATTSGRLQQKIEEAKEKSKERRERHKAKRRPDEIQKRNLVVDEDGVAHDSEYVQFRTATPVHLQKRQPPPDHPNDDASASSSSASESDGESGFHSSPYTYQSTHRTASSHHAPTSAAYTSTISAIPPYLAGHRRTSIDAGPSSLSVPRAPSPHHRAGASASLYDGASGHSGLAYDRIGPGYGSRVTSSKLRAASSPMRPHATTASYQPPAPTFSPNDPLRLPTIVGGAGSSTVSGGDAPSFIESTAQLSLGGSGSGAAGESGYNKAARAAKASAMRPPKLDGTALDAGMHGLNRSWDGFKLDMRFGAHKVGKKLSRKINSAI
ncbi:hypothetical protein JCM10449v2_001698 [Rhodotorula kratochvilovae]